MASLKKVRVLASLTVLLILLVPTLASSQKGPPVHENYSAATWGRGDLATLVRLAVLFYFEETVDFVTLSNYSMVYERLNSSGLIDFTVVRDLKSFLDTYENTTRLLEATHFGIGNATLLIELDSFDEARRSLVETNESVADAKTNIELLSKGLQLLGERFNIDISRPMEYVEKLRRDAEAKAELIEELQTSLRALEVELSLAVSPDIVMAGDEIEVRGRLMDVEGRPVGGRNVAVNIDQVGTFEDATSPEGDYSLTVEIPIGTPPRALTAYASFTPQGDDKARYLSANSSDVFTVVYLPVKLEVAIERPEAYINQSVSFRGRLLDEEGSPMPARSVALSLDWMDIGSTITDSEGAFVYNYTILLGISEGGHYIRAVFQSLSERYWTISDAGVLRVLYFPSAISLDVSPRSLYPYQEITLNGGLFGLGSPLANREVDFELDGAVFNSTLTKEDGSFALKYSLNETISQGLHLVRAFFEPRRVDDTFTRSESIQWMYVAYIHTSLIGSLPSFSFSGFPVTLNGSLLGVRDKPIPQANVTILLNGRPVGEAFLQSDGRFKFTHRLDIGLNSRFQEDLNYTIIYRPSEPWITPSAWSGEVKMWNTVNLTVAGAVIVILSIQTVRWARLRRRVVHEEAVITPVETPAVEPFPEVEKREEAIETLEWALLEGGCNEKVRAAYHKMRRILASQAGFQADASETHWEYFKRLSDTYKGVVNPARIATGTYEKAEYSGLECEEDEAQEAVASCREVASQIVEVGRI